jgi:hypothetical protein
VFVTAAVAVLPLCVCLQPASTAQPCRQEQQQQQHQLQSCTISVPAQITLLPGTSSQQALAQLAAAGIGLPALVKPLSSMPADSTPGAAAAAAGSEGVCIPASSIAAAAAAVADGHALGVVMEERGVQQLLAGAVPELALPVVVQQFVPHGEALYKVRPRVARTKALDIEYVSNHGGKPCTR